MYSENHQWIETSYKGEIPEDSYTPLGLIDSLVIPALKHPDDLERDDLYGKVALGPASAGEILAISKYLTRMPNSGTIVSRHLATRKATGTKHGMISGKCSGRTVRRGIFRKTFHRRIQE